MYCRQAFVTNSSSTCFIAFGIRAKVVDREKFAPLEDGWNAEEIMKGTGVSVAYGQFDDDLPIFYLTESEQGADEYDTWQPIEHQEIIDRDAAKKTLLDIAEKYGCEHFEGPYWGFYNSGH